MMLKRFKDFIKENVYFDEDKKVRTGISYDIDQTQIDSFSEYGSNEIDWVNNVADKLNLINGMVVFHKNLFEIDGVTNDGHNIKISQAGNYNDYGGPYDPKMNEPVFNVDGYDVYFIVKKHFKKEGCIQKDNEADLTRIDLYPMDAIKKFLGLPKDKKDNIINSLRAFKKFDL